MSVQSSCFSSTFPLPPIKHLSFLYFGCFYRSLSPPHTQIPPTTFPLLLWLRRRSGRLAHQREEALSVGAARTVHVGGLQSSPPPALIRALHPTKKKNRAELQKEKREGGEERALRTRLMWRVWAVSRMPEQSHCEVAGWAVVFVWSSVQHRVVFAHIPALKLEIQACDKRHNLIIPIQMFRALCWIKSVKSRLGFRVSKFIDSS